MASSGDYTSKLAEISSEMATANAYMAMALKPDTLLSGLSLQGIQQCVGKLLVAIPGITAWGLEDSNTSRMVVNAMTSVVNELSGIFVDIFVPVDFDVDPDSLAGSVDNYMKSILTSLTNPLAAIIATQQNLLSSSLASIKGILYNSGPSADRGLINQYSEKLERIFKTMFMGDADLGLAGIVMFAFEEGIPAIESEFIYLRHLKKLAKTGLEDVANLPDSIGSPEIMNASTVSKLCCADTELRKVEDILRRDNVFDRKTFGQATKCVCTAKDNIFNGKLDQDFINFHAGNFTGMNPAQIKDLANLKFMPNLQFRLNIIQINAYINAFNEADQDTRTLHNNFLLAIDTLDRLAETRLGDIMALLVGLLRQQIAGVRNDLEAQAQGFSGVIDAKTESDARKTADIARRQALANITTEQRRADKDSKGVPAGSLPPAASAATTQPYASGLAGTPAATVVRPGEKGSAFGSQQVDVYAYMSAQAGAYVVLTAACKIMQATSAIYSGLDKVLAGESRVVKFIKDFVGDMKTKCPNAQGGGQVVVATAAYVRALQDRLNGKTTSNQQVIVAAETMLKSIETYEKFLKCFKLQLFFGNQQLAALVSSLANALAAYRTARALIQQIKMLIRLYPQLKQMYKNLDLLKILGLDGISYNALDTLVGALQCLVLQCDNPFVTDLASKAAQQFSNEFGKRRASAITMGSLDEIPKSGMLGIILKKVQAIMRLIELINSLTNFNIRELCNVKTPATTSGPTLAKLAAGFDQAKSQDLVIDTAPWRKVTQPVQRKADGSLA